MCNYCKATGQIRVESPKKNRQHQEYKPVQTLPPHIRETTPDRMNTDNETEKSENMQYPTGTEYQTYRIQNVQRNNRI
ncbi:uncharacterized protein VTP21DRAFT_11339 [Calcarisporiella thermophila]|uniref:uncharacterized protein n=1 Tax=Calcarisporiella thermophila TaxID=911321 RepID=UPI0037423721